MPPCRHRPSRRDNPSGKLASVGLLHQEGRDSSLLSGPLSSELPDGSLLPDAPDVLLDEPPLELPDPLLLDPPELLGPMESSLDEGSPTLDSGSLLLPGGSLLNSVDGASLLLVPPDDESLSLDDPLDE